MNRQNQTRIIEEMITGLRDHMLANLHKVPEKWDGTELRQWMSDIAAEQFATKRDRRLGMWKDYENTRLVKNL